MSERDEQCAKRLARRLLNFIEHNCQQYIRNRELGNYREAVKRLERAAKGAAMVNQAQAEGRLRLGHDDWTTVQMVRRHLDAMSNNVLDFCAASAQYGPMPT